MRRILSLMLLFLGIAFPMYAQVTTASVAGLACEEDASKPVAGVTVLAVHEPTGTRYFTLTGENGHYSLTGLRSGGPYTVTFSMPGYAEVSFPELTLALGVTTQVNASLSPVELDAATLSAMGGKMRLTRTGSSQNIVSSQIEAMPTVSRSITDYIRLSPYANGLSLAGGDGRTTNYTVDGANFNNNYGINTSLPGGGIRLIVAFNASRSAFSWPLTL